MLKSEIISFYQLVLSNRVRSWKNGEISNAEYEEWIMEVYQNLQGLGLNREEAADLINTAELS